MSLGWDHSADAWIAYQGDAGDQTRQFVLDAPMLEALPKKGTVLDIGCGEGQFCRKMRTRGLEPTGIDITERLIEVARERDPETDYYACDAAGLPFRANLFDAAVFYLSLIDVPDFRKAIKEAARILRPGGRLLIANLHAHTTARPREWSGEGNNWVKDGGARKHFAVDDISTEREIVSSWRGIRIVNHHRPLSAYMTALLDTGLILRCFEEPPYTGPDPHFRDKYSRVPWAFLMAWDKPKDIT